MLLLVYNVHKENVTKSQDRRNFESEREPSYLHNNPYRLTSRIYCIMQDTSLISYLAHHQDFRSRRKMGRGYSLYPLAPCANGKYTTLSLFLRPFRYLADDQLSFQPIRDGQQQQ